MLTPSKNADFYLKVAERIHQTPQIAANSFIASHVTMVGDIAIGENSSVWYQSVIRGDVNNITIGKGTNIQDGTVIHVSSILQGTYIGNYVTVGHQALLHACTIGDKAFIGMKACIMDGATVEAGAMVAANALVPPGKTVPSGELWAGSPARKMRDLTDDDYKMIENSAAHYIEIAKTYLNEGIK